MAAGTRGSLSVCVRACLPAFALGCSHLLSRVGPRSLAGVPRTQAGTARAACTAFQGELASTWSPVLACRFESRWTSIRVADDDKCIFLRGMGGTVAGVWCAHGEGRAIFPDDTVRQDVLSRGGC
jgi:CobB/CobQ-like glutamine amidotransferase domain